MAHVTHIYWVPNPIQHSHELQLACIANYCQTRPEMIQINREKKPVCLSHPIEFSVSHTNNIFGIAIAKTPIGFDIEPMNRPVPWAIFNRNRTTPITSFNAATWNTPNQLNDHLARIYHWTRWEATCKLTGKGLHFPILPQSSSQIQSFLWQDLCCSVASLVPIEELSFFCLKTPQNAGKLSDKTLKWSTDTVEILPLD